MKKYSSIKIREMWLNFWKSKNHEIYSSASLIPKNNPSLLWVNSGVSILKDYFSGEKIPKNPRIANIQKSIRTNDIDNVGYTARHHTFFEMLGNFSIGDYFKDEILEWALEFLLKVLKLNKNKIYITYYNEDIYTYEKWKKLGILENHLIKGNKKTNFWDIGSGPCGPDTEIFYDRGIKYDPKKKGIELLKKNIENDRYIEIWNIVFSQLNNDGEGNYIELKQKNIDTGVGFERLVSILQNVPTNFDTDLFIPIIKKIETMTNKKYNIKNYFIKDKKQSKINRHFQIIADHIRAIIHAINDGAIPSNTKRGYIIRQLIRRAYHSGMQLGILEKSFLHKLTQIVNDSSSIYPININKVENIIKKEEIDFLKVIIKGKKLLFKSIKNNKKFNTKIVFKLFESHGLPIEISKEILKKENIKLNMKELKKLKIKHSKKSKEKNNIKLWTKIQITQKIKKKVSDFIGYDFLESNSNIIFKIKEKNKYYILLDKTPFYATKGGQIHDKGTINNIEVIDVFKDKYDNHWHVLPSEPKNKKVDAKINKKIRLSKARNHSGTHILGHVLREVISKDIIQLGSENNENKLRFDFPLDHLLTKKEIQKIENKANKLIKAKINCEYIIDSFKNGIKMGALAIDNDIDSNLNRQSRIVKFGDSIEFCGGTHVANTSIIEKIKIIKIKSKGSRTYRIEAITSNKTIKKFELKEKKKLINSLNNLIKNNKKLNKNYNLQIKNMSLNEIIKLIVIAKNDNKNLNKKQKILKDDSNIKFTNYKNIKTYIKLNVDPKNVKNTSIILREKHPNKLFIIGSSSLSHNEIIIAIASKKYNSLKIFEDLAKKYNGKGGGNSEFAMGVLKNSNINFK